VSPPDLLASSAIKLILDNHSAHISKQTKAFLATQPAGRFEPTFTPKHGSWLNLVEGFQREQHGLLRAPQPNGRKGRTARAELRTIWKRQRLMPRQLAAWSMAAAVRLLGAVIASVALAWTASAAAQTFSGFPVPTSATLAALFRRSSTSSSSWLSFDAALRCYLPFFQTSIVGDLFWRGIVRRAAGLVIQLAGSAAHSVAVAARAQQAARGLAAARWFSVGACAGR
jgi:hypothetical protein